MYKNFSVAKSCQTLCHLMNCSTPGFSFFHYLPEFAQTFSKEQASFMAAVTIHTDSGAQENKSVTVSTFHLFAMQCWTKCHDLHILNVEF